MSLSYTKEVSSIGNRIYEERRKKGLTQSRLGKLCGANEQDVRAWEAGKKMPTNSNLAKLNKIFGNGFADKKEEIPVNVQSVMVSAAETMRKEEKKDIPPVVEVKEKTIGEMIRGARLAAGLSQRETAEIIGMDNSNLSKYEHDRWHPSYENAKLLDEYFHLDICTRLYPDHEIVESIKNTVKEVVVEEVKAAEVKEVPKTNVQKIDDYFIENACRAANKNNIDIHEVLRGIGIAEDYFGRSPYDRDPLTLFIATNVAKKVGSTVEELCKNPEEDELKRRIEAYKAKIAELEAKLNA